MKLKKIIAAVCSIVMATSVMAFSTISVAADDENPYKDVAFEFRNGKTAMSATNRAKSNYITVAVPGLAGEWDTNYENWSGEFVRSGALFFAVETGILSDATLAEGGNFLYDPKSGEKAKSNFFITFAENYEETGYDLIAVMWAVGAYYGAIAEYDAEIAEVKLSYKDKNYSDDIVLEPYDDGNKYSYISFCDINGEDIPYGSTAKIKGLNPDYTYTLSGTSNTVTATKKATGGDEPGTTVTPSIGGTTQSDAEAFTEYADATAAGKFEGESSSDQATAFAATITNGEIASTGNIVWKVTDGSTTKYHKQSLGGNIAGSGTANVGLIVRGLYSDTATAGIAFLQ